MGNSVSTSQTKTMRLLVLVASVLYISLVINGNGVMVNGEESPEKEQGNDGGMDNGLERAEIVQGQGQAIAVSRDCPKECKYRGKCRNRCRGGGWESIHWGK